MVPFKLPSRLSFCVLITALLIPFGQAAAAGDLGVNLLSNPGFSTTSGWSLEEGTKGTRSSTPRSPDGGSYFYAGENPQTTIYQEIDVEALGYDTHRLDTGGYYVEYGGYHRSMEQEWWVEDRSLIELKMQDASEAQIGQSNLGWGDSTSWYLRQGSTRVAAGTRQLEYRFQAQRLTPAGENNAYLDGAFLELYEYPIWTWGDNSHDYTGAGPWTVSETLLIGAGEGGSGGLEISNAATVTTNGSTYVGELATSDGTVNVSGGTWDANADVYVGVAGTGRVNVTSGIMDVADLLTVGVNGTLSVDGQLSLGGAGAVTVGNTLLLDGGRAACAMFGNTSGGTFQFNAGTLAYLGDLTVDSATIFGAVGAGGDTISSGRTLEVAGELELVGPPAELTLAGGRVACTTFDNPSGGMFQFDAGTLAYLGDLTVDSATIFAAAGVGGDTISSGRTLEVAGGLELVGLSAELTLDAGGRVACTTFDNTSGGTFQFDGGTLAYLGNLTVDSATPFGAVGGDAISSGRTLEVADTLTLGATGTLTLDGGGITCSAFDNSAGGSFSHDSGTLTVLGGAFDPGTADYSVDGPGTAELHLAGGSAALSGDLVVADTTNGTSGTILVTAADYFDLTSTLDNSGQVNLIGGTIHVAAAATNAADGVISGHGGLLLDGGLLNHGTMNFGADTEIYGDVANGEWGELGTDGEIVISGGASVSFHGDMASNGAKFKVSENADVVFFGTLSGGGSITGGGGVWIEGIFSPGNSPGDVLFGGDLMLGPDALLQIELGGTDPGTNYDVLNVLGLASLGGTLDVKLLDGFEPSAGDEFDLFNFASQSGTFDEILLPDLTAGLSWDDSQLAATGMLAVVPEPGTFLLAALGLLGLFGWGWRRRR